MLFVVPLGVGLEGQEPLQKASSLSAPTPRRCSSCTTPELEPDLEFTEACLMLLVHVYICIYVFTYTYAWNLCSCSFVAYWTMEPRKIEDQSMVLTGTHLQVSGYGGGGVYKGSIYLIDRPVY